ncbi:dTDP-4-dehydrorhamnose 3,5-epimerase [Bradyrhizobium sp.]|jgi:dTDP-4-dehydrorhamnose 3,5-epimerase|uniref:dTDP-4-dehydrorhamnose 3,5-epimerase n=1 Tax=Bradyrhizobium sp. TaxID=376 RepID=UPI003C1654E3
MQFHNTTFRDTWLVQLEPIHDTRGFFVRTFCVDEFGARGLETNFPQHSASYSGRKGTLRGMHYQCPPHSEVKLVRCVKGAIWDIIVDIRPDSPTFRCWEGFELSESNHRQLYIPRGFAHGFQTLSEGVEVNYLISERYVAEAARGIRHDDPSFAIQWPLPVSEISAKDLRWPDFSASSTSRS